MPLLFWLFAKIFFGFRKPKITILGSEFAGEESLLSLSGQRRDEGLLGIPYESLNSFGGSGCISSTVHGLCDIISLDTISLGKHGKGNPDDGWQTLDGS